MWNDLRFSARTLWRSPGLTLLAVLSLALGIGANTAIFSLLYQVVLRSLPVRDPASLAILESNDDSYGYTRRDNNQTVFSYPAYKALRDRNHAMQGLLARVSFPATLAYRGDALPATAEVVSGNFFDVLGVRPALGRLLLPSDDGPPGRDPVIVLSYSYWKGRLGANPAVLNARMLMNRQPVLVVGVAPSGFRGVLTGRDPDFFAPLSMMTMISPGLDRIDHPDFYWLSVVGRLRPSVSPKAAGAAMEPLFRAALREEIPQMDGVTAEASQKLLAKPLMVRPAAQGLNALRAQWQTPLTVLTVMVGLVLLIACANVANLLLARAAGRQREIAVRLAVGATRWRLARLLMAESGVLAVTGGMVGLLLSGYLADGLLSLLPADATGGWLTSQLDGRLLGYSLALALLTAMLFGLAPVLQSMRSGVALALKHHAAGWSGGGTRSRAQQALIVTQICISLWLLIGAGLFTRSLVSLTRSDPGLRADHLLTFSIDPSLAGYGFDQRLALYHGLQQRLSAMAGTESVAVAYLVPLGGWGMGSGVKVPGSRAAGQEYVTCNMNSVTPGYFHTLGIPLLVGREFNAGDGPKSARVAILNESFARFLFEGANPIGRRVMIGSLNDADAEVVGIVRDSRINDLREKPPHVLYTPYDQGGDELTRQAAFFVRARGDERRLMGSARAAVKQLDANLPVDRLASLRVIIDDSIYTERLLATLAVAFGGLAASLAAVGLYGIVSYSVARRAREFGIRLALGAAPRALLTFILREVGWLVGIGVAIGLPVSYALGRLAESALFGIRAHDPIAMAGAITMVVAVGLLAGLAPALRAMRIDPLRALRYE